MSEEYVAIECRNCGQCDAITITEFCEANPELAPSLLHRLARLDGDNADGNPATLGLLDQALKRHMEMRRLLGEITPHVTEYTNEETDKQYLRMMALTIDVEIDLNQLKRQIELQENTGR